MKHFFASRWLVGSSSESKNYSVPSDSRLKSAILLDAPQAPAQVLKNGVVRKLRRDLVSRGSQPGMESGRPDKSSGLSKGKRST